MSSKFKIYVKESAGAEKKHAVLVEASKTGEEICHALHQLNIIKNAATLKTLKGETITSAAALKPNDVVIAVAKGEPAPASAAAGGNKELEEMIAKQGEIVKNLKANKAAKEEIDAAVVILKELKAKAADGGKPVAPADAAGSKAPKKSSPATGSGSSSGGGGAAAPAKGGKGPVSGGITTEEGLGISAKKMEDFSSWYTQVVTKAEMIDYHDISGCYILRPWSYHIWEQIQKFFDGEIKKLGVQNSYFPLFVSERALCREKDHIEGFAPEVAWVTRAGKTDLTEPIAVRPTSETVMYPLYANWVRSHRDLPLRLNQWASVVRWEFKDPVPFIRSREFLWQEGHTAFATKAEADKEVLEILDLYSQVYEKLLCVPVVKGTKSVKEKFAGADYTTTIEGFIPANGRAIQAATSHCLGQNFAKMFNIEFENTSGGRSHVWQNSWGLTTRSIGVMVMLHGDDKGLVLPPMVAPIQVVVVPIMSKDSAAVVAKATEFVSQLKAVGLRAFLDDRVNYTPGWKFNHWELKGVPLRVEIGPKDLEKGLITYVRRDDGSKSTTAIDGAIDFLQNLLTTIQGDMLSKATKERDSLIEKITEWKDFVRNLDRKRMCLVPWCEQKPCEDDIKVRSALPNGGVDASSSQLADAEAQLSVTTTLTGAAKSLCIPHAQDPMPADQKCFACGCKATKWTLFGRSY